MFNMRTCKCARFILAACPPPPRRHLANLHVNKRCTPGPCCPCVGTAKLIKKKKVGRFKPSLNIYDGAESCFWSFLVIKTGGEGGRGRGGRAWQLESFLIRYMTHFNFSSGFVNFIQKRRTRRNRILRTSLDHPPHCLA